MCKGCGSPPFFHHHAYVRSYHGRPSIGWPPALHSARDGGGEETNGIFRGWLTLTHHFWCARLTVFIYASFLSPCLSPRLLLLFLLFCWVERVRDGRPMKIHHHLCPPFKRKMENIPMAISHSKNRRRERRPKSEDLLTLKLTLIVPVSFPFSFLRNRQTWENDCEDWHI